jgi:flagellar hook-length control protein FliK
VPAPGKGDQSVTVPSSTQTSSTEELLERELTKVVSKLLDASNLSENFPKELFKELALEAPENKADLEPSAKLVEVTEKDKFKIEFNRMQLDTLLKKSEIKLQLNPPSLGSVKIKLVSSPQEFTARIETSNDSAMKIVEQNLPQLKEGLEKAGIRIDHIEVVLGEEKSRQQQSQNQNQRKRKIRNEYDGTSLSELLPIINLNSPATDTLQFGRLNLVA